MWDDEDALFNVVVNDEDQYSVWPAHRDAPDGWRTVRDPAPKAECLAYIERTWTDMRPASLRRWMEAGS